MEVVWSIVAGILMACGIYLLLERHILRVLFGLILISNAVNLSIFLSGRLTPGNPPLVALGETLPANGIANSLPQALILTAIVIGFGLLVFSLVLGFKAYQQSQHADVDDMQLSEEEPQE